MSAQISHLVSLLLEPSKSQEALVGLAEYVDDERQRGHIRRFLAASGATPVMLSCLASPHDRIRDKAAYLVCLLAFEDEGRVLLADNSGIDCILACVSDPRNTVYQREKCAYALSNMANHKTLRPKVVAAQGVEPLIQLIKSISGNAEKCCKLVVPATTALSKLIKLDDVTCQQVVNSGVIEHLMQLGESESNEMATAAIDGMGKLFDFMALPRTHAGKTGVFEGLLGILARRHTEGTSFGPRVLKASESINLMLVNNLSNRQLALKNGVYNEHIRMLKEDNKDLIEKALNFLRNFTENYKEGQEAMMRRDPTVIPRILHLLQEGSRITLGALCHLSQHENAKAELPTAKIAEILQPLLQVPGLTEIERARVAVILANLSDDRLDMAIDLTIINFLANKMALTLNGEEDRWSLLTFVNGIANLASSDHNKEVIGQSGIIEILFDILQVDAKKCTHGRVLTYLDESKATSATALWNLAYHESNRRIMRELGGLDILTQIADSTTEERLKKNAKGTLWLLGIRDETPTKDSGHNSEENDKGEMNDVYMDCQVMISYHSSNLTKVKAISHALDALGYKTWYDVEAENCGFEIVTKVIEKASVVLICLCEEYKESPRCRSELEYINTRRKEFIPVLLEPLNPGGWLKAQLSAHTPYDLTDLSFGVGSGNSGGLCLFVFFFFSFSLFLSLLYLCDF
eukprot:Phypoly_transcript_02819.p1 GENE.Phypoly_transcript_02819~~Phypoly_transcript_02819.p1  ORF type:complete len:691 (+),score=89.12 Phypoly_transcript_02819:143-2215(+)